MAYTYACMHVYMCLNISFTSFKGLDNWQLEWEGVGTMSSAIGVGVCVCGSCYT